MLLYARACERMLATAEGQARRGLKKCKLGVGKEGTFNIFMHVFEELEISKERPFLKISKRIL